MTEGRLAPAGRAGQRRGCARREHQNFVPRDDPRARFMCLSALRRGYFSFRAAETVKLGDTRACWRHPGRLALDISHASLAPGVDGVEGEIEIVFSRLARVAQRCDCVKTSPGGHETIQPK